MTSPEYFTHIGPKVVGHYLCAMRKIQGYYLLVLLYESDTAQRVSLLLLQSTTPSPTKVYTHMRRACRWTPKKVPAQKILYDGNWTRCINVTVIHLSTARKFNPEPKQRSNCGLIPTHIYIYMYTINFSVTGRKSTVS